MQGQENAAAYQKLPAALRAQIEAHPMVAEHGMPAHIAAMLMGSSGHGNQTPFQAMRHNATPVP